MNSKVNWYEIPVANLERAITFYSAVFQQEMQSFDADESRKLALMPPGAGKVDDIDPQGSLLQVEGFEPGANGSVIYLDPVDDLETVLGRVESAGGKVTFPKFRIGHGYLATFIDSEGNTMGLLAWDKEDNE